MPIFEVSTEAEIKRCADIWLQGSLAAHDFIAPEFWHENLNAMREHYLPASTLYAIKEASELFAFAAVHEGRLAALFVSPDRWGKSFGGQLLRHVQKVYPELQLSVYTKNVKAMQFYLKHGFKISSEQICPHTKEPEMVMCWRK